jgi:hypothetical protein
VRVSLKTVKELYGIECSVIELHLLRKRGWRGWLQLLPCDRLFWEAHLVVDGSSTIAISPCGVAFEAYDWEFENGCEVVSGLSLHLSELARCKYTKLNADRPRSKRASWRAKA